MRGRSSSVCVSVALGHVWRGRAYTLVELMLVVAIVGVLAALAIFGVRTYLSAAKSSEAKSMVGEISRSAYSAFEREVVPSEAVAEGTESSAATHALCDSSVPVPGAVPKGTKYQPSTTDGTDFETGNEVAGWRCLRFRVNQPIYYLLQYTMGSSPLAPGNPAQCGGECYEAGAMGDVDGDGLYSRFARTGFVNAATKMLTVSTSVYIENEAE